MSRTFRRKSGDPSDRLWHISEHRRIPGTYSYERIYYVVGSDQYKKGLAKYRSDSGTHNCKEPGPSWFRNLTSERPQRRFNRNELRKFMRNEEYEPMIISRDRLDYWT